MPKFLKALPLALLLACLLSAAEARADAVVVNAGSATVGNARGGPFSLSAGGALLNGGMNWGTNSCSGCRAGQTVSVGSFNLGLDLRPGAATVNGVSYNQLFYAGFLSFDASLVLPEENASLFTLTTPFTFSGSLEGCLRSNSMNPCGAEDVVFNSLLTGQGTATVTLTSFLDPTFGRLFSIQSVRYDFAPTPTPEPATLALLGTGLAGAAAARRRRRKASGGGDS